MSSKTASKTYRKLNRKPNPVKNPGSPDRKAHAKLGVRIADYARMVGTGKGNYDGYHKPGSMQR